MDDVRLFFHLISGVEPRPSDFLSSKARGYDLDDPKHEDIWDGVSMFATQAQARKRSLKWGKPGKIIYLAEMHVPVDGSFRFERTLPGRAGHHTIWGEPEALCNLAEYVITIRQ